MKQVVIIPAYNPDKILIELVKELKQYYKLIVIDDGSNQEHKLILKKIEKDVILIENKNNKGKGISIKIGMEEILKQNLDIQGIITADADGQHTVKDIKKVGKSLEKNNCFILGVRDIDKMPIRNKIGNKISKILIERKYKIKINDTQTGLRGIPKRYIEDLINIEGKRYEYEMEVIKYILEKKQKFKEVQIDTIYNKNKKSKFNILKDSLTIIKHI